MSQFLILSHLEVQNANSIAGLTWGFPAITQFLGFTHALNRKLSNEYEGDYPTQLTGCAVISHTIYNKVYQPKEYADFEFLQSKNPPVLAKHKSASPPIIEEGKMNLTVSLVIELVQPLTLTSEQIKQFEQLVLNWCYHLRVAGGTVLHAKSIKLLSASTLKQEQVMLAKIKRLTMPGFVLLDKSNYLHEHHQASIKQHERERSTNPQPEIFDAWLDFSARKYQAEPQINKDEELNESTSASWNYVPKPRSGYLVPLMTGYKAISELYEPMEVLNTRDETTPSRFVEAIHSVGEWQGMHRTSNIDDIIWRYHQDGQWYLCQQRNTNIKQQSEDDATNEQMIEPSLENNLNQVLNSLF
jgi:CRISPR-associated protein Csy2